MTSDRALRIPVPAGLRSRVYESLGNGKANGYNHSLLLQPAKIIAIDLVSYDATWSSATIRRFLRGGPTRDGAGPP